MGRKDRRQQAKQAIANPPSRKIIKADKRILLLLGVVGLALVLITFFARNNNVF